MDITQKTAHVPGLVRHYRFNSLPEVMRYWTELEYISLYSTTEDTHHPETEEEEWGLNEDEVGNGEEGASSGISKEGSVHVVPDGDFTADQHEDPPTTVLDPGTIPSLAFKPNWANVVMLRKEEKNILDKYLSQLGGTSPTRNQVKQISTDTGIPLQAVLSHLKALKRKNESAIAKQQRSKLTKRASHRQQRETPSPRIPLQRRRRRISGSALDGVQEENHDSVGEQLAITTTSPDETKATSSKRRRWMKVRSPFFFLPKNQKKKKLIAAS